MNAPFQPLYLAALLAVPGAACAQAVAAIPVKAYAQELVDRTTVEHSSLQVVVLHVSPAKGAPNVVVASNIGRLGKAADEDDLKVIATGQDRVRRTADGRRIDVELPLYDVAGETIGAVSLIWRPSASDDTAALEREAQAIRDGLSRRILTAASLLDPYPYVPSATLATHAQKLVDATLQSHPDVRVLALRGRQRSDGALVLLGSSFGRHGKPADADDLKVLAATAPATGLYSGGRRFGVDLPLHDAAGAPIGTMNVGYAWHAGDDQAALLDRAVALRDEVQARVLATAPLDELDP